MPCTAGIRCRTLTCENQRVQSQKSKRPRAPKSLRTPGHRNLVAVLVGTRRQAALTQRQLAARLNWPYAVIARIESGERRLDVIEFAEYARGLNVPPETLFSRVMRW